MVGTSRRIGQWIYKAVRSPTWRAIIDTTQEMRELPQKIVREAGIEEAMQEVKETVNEAKTQVSAATTEINSEMRAATQEVAQEMQISANSLNGENPTPTYPVPNFGTSFNQPWSAPAGSTPTSSFSVYPPLSTGLAPFASAPRYALPWADLTAALATGPSSAADLDGIVVPPEPPPPPLAAPELISGALGLVASGMTPADLEVAFVFADPTDYPDPEPKPAPMDTSEAAADEAAAGQDLAVAEATDAPAAESLDPALAEETSAVSLALEQRMREMDEALARLDAKILPAAEPAPTDPAAEAAASAENAETAPAEEPGPFAASMEQRMRELDEAISKLDGAYNPNPPPPDAPAQAEI
jgi:hypothetical protein